MHTFGEFNILLKRPENIQMGPMLRVPFSEMLNMCVQFLIEYMHTHISFPTHGLLTCLIPYVEKRALKF